MYSFYTRNREIIVSRERTREGEERKRIREHKTGR